VYKTTVFALSFCSDAIKIPYSSRMYLLVIIPISGDNVTFTFVVCELRKYFVRFGRVTETFLGVRGARNIEKYCLKTLLNKLLVFHHVKCV